jgi:hypothetical protein
VVKFKRLRTELDGWMERVSTTGSMTVTRPVLRSYRLEGRGRSGKIVLPLSINELYKLYFPVTKQQNEIKRRAKEHSKNAFTDF